MTGRAIMLQGTGSDVGKSLLVAGFAGSLGDAGSTRHPSSRRICRTMLPPVRVEAKSVERRRLSSRCGAAAVDRDMNPLLLKPEGDRRAQVVLNGKALRSEEAAAYMANRGSLLPIVIEAFDRLRSAHDLVIVEGAGSPAEVNLRKGDIANMGFARATDVPVVLVGDIDRGGIIASLVGTRAVIDTEDAEMIAGFAINRFRGDQATCSKAKAFHRRPHRLA